MVIFSCAQNVLATQTWLEFRAGCTMPIYNGYTVQTISTNSGTNMTTLPFSKTTTYDFYSPPLGQSVPLTTSDKSGGVVYMENTGTTVATDFSVTGDMHFYDYNPATGAQVSIVDTGASSPKNVNHGQNVNWAIPNAAIATNYTIPAGHMIHVALTLGLVSGNPGTAGLLVYNGPSGPSTSGFLPQNRSAALDWQFNTSVVYGKAAKMLCISAQPGGKMLVSCAGSATTSYSIQACTNLQSSVWTTVGATNSDSNGLFSFVDQHAGSYPCCFYRAMTAAP